MPPSPSSARATRRALLGGVAAAVVVAAASAPLGAQGPGHDAHHATARRDTGAVLGAITFPTSARPAARAAFVRGVLFLHNFHYPQAVRAFQRARALDSADVMSAAFEALAYTHPVWNEQDTARARGALRSLAPTREARLALARTSRERAWLDAVESLYDGDAPKAVRDSAFSRGMAAIHAADPRDPEAATFYALSLLGLNQGVREPRAYEQAEAIADSVLRVHPRHPGALHYKIHAVDAPTSATRGLAAARLYGEVAPSAGHALHMTSHIFMARGMWDDVVAANRRAQAVSPPHAFGHGTHWLVYGLLQQGRVHEAKAWVDSMMTVKREEDEGKAPPASRGNIDVHAILIPSTYVVEAEAWDTPLGHARLDTAQIGSVALLARADFHVGYAAARRAGRPVDVAGGSRAADRALADSMLERIASRNASAHPATVPERTALGQARVMERMLRAELMVARGRGDSAVALLRDAATELEALPFEFGPPMVPKPPRERAAEILLLRNKPAEALAELDLAERLAPNRSLAQMRRVRALTALGRHAEARRVLAALAASWSHAEPDFPMLAEARWGHGDLPELGRGGSVAAARSAVVDTIEYPSGELRLRGTLWRPAGGGRHPAVIVLHGSRGCWQANDTDWLGRMFAAHGYVSFFPCRRGQGLSEGRGEAALAQLQREGALTATEEGGARATELLTTTQLADVRAAIAAARARREVDAARVAVMGISYGGILTLLAAEADSTLMAAVPFAPAAMNWEWNTALRERLLAGARRTRVPMLVVQAENDWSTGPVRALPAAVRDGGGSADGRLYPAVGGNASTGHGLMIFAPNAWRDDVLAFLDAHAARRPTAVGARQGR